MFNGREPKYEECEGVGGGKVGEIGTFEELKYVKNEI